MRNLHIKHGLCIAGFIALAGIGSTRVLAADASLVLKATFDQENADDSSGRGNHGTITGGVEFTEGVRGKALHLTNPAGIAGEYKTAEQYVNFGEPADLKFGTEDFSVLFWYKSDGSDSEEVAVIGNKDWNSGGNEGLTIADFRNGMGLNFTAQGTGRLDTDRIGAATDNEWHHIAAVFDRDDVMALYVDGIKTTEKDISSRAGKSIDVTDFVLGADGYKRFGVKDSYIDELEVYKKAFTEEEIWEMDASGQLMKAIAGYEEIVNHSDASQEKKDAFLSVLREVKAEAEKVTDAKEAEALLQRLKEAYRSFSRPVKGIAEFEVISDVHIRQDNDTETNSAHFIDALKDINEMFPDTLGVMNSGDFADSGNEEQCKRFFDIIDRFGGEIPEFLTALGNHDVRWKSGWDEIYERYMRYNQKYMGDTDGKVYFDKWLGGYHFLVLNTEWDLKDRAYISQDQIRWLDEKIAENNADGKPVFLFLHQAMRDTYFNSNDWDVGVQDHEIKEVLRKYPNVILFTGHIHNGLGACDVVETDFGAMVDVPAFYSNDYGDARGQLGYHVTVYEDKVLLSMYDYKNDVFLPEYDHTISLKGSDFKKSRVLSVSFDDKTADDGSGYGNHGTVAGTPEFVPGIKGNAIRLVNGEGHFGDAVPAEQYVDFGKAESLRFGTDDFSILFWYKGNLDGSPENSIVSNKNWYYGANPGFTLGVFGTGNRGMSLNFTANGSGRADTGRFAQVMDGSWHMVAATFDRDGEMTLYLDGKKAGSKDISEQKQNSIDIAEYGLVLGADGNLQYGAKDICIDEFSVYKALLGPGEIESAYQPYAVEVRATEAEITWQPDDVTEPAYVLLNGARNQDLAAGTSRITISGLKPETDYDVLVVTREKAHIGNYKDAFSISIRTQPKLASEAQIKMLLAICEAYTGFDETAYTKETAEALKDALDKAKLLMQADRILEEEAQSAADDVLKAAAALKPDLSQVAGAVEQAQRQMLLAIRQAYAKLDTTGYTTDTVKALNEALSNADKLLNQETVTEAEIKSAADNILKAAVALKPDLSQIAGAVEQERRQMLLAIRQAYAKLDTTGYTTDTVKALNEALSNADKLLNQETVTEAEIKSAAEDILKAAAALKPDLSQLMEELQKAQRQTLLAIRQVYAKLDTTGYTTETVGALNEALSNADLLLNQETASEEALKGAADDILKAAAALKLIPSNDTEQLKQAQEAARAEAEARKKAEADLALAREAQKAAQEAAKAAKEAEQAAKEAAAQAKAQAQFTSKKAAIISVKKSGKKNVKISWKKVDGAEGYVIEYATNSNFKKAKKATIKKAVTQKIIKNLKPNKKYYFRIRAYQTVDGKKIYTKVSAKKQFKLKN